MIRPALLAILAFAIVFAPVAATRADDNMRCGTRLVRVVSPPRAD